MHKKIRFILFILVLITACNPKGNQSEEVIEVLELPEGFDEFYTSFHKDSNFQKEHIVFPFTAQETSVDSITRVTRDIIYDEENWNIHQLITDPGFQRDYSILGDMVTEIAMDKMGLMTIERRWGKLDTSWYLINYHVTNRSW